MVRSTNDPILLPTTDVEYTYSSKDLNGKR